MRSKCKNKDEVINRDKRLGELLKRPNVGYFYRVLGYEEYRKHLKMIQNCMYTPINWNSYAKHQISYIWYQSKWERIWKITDRNTTPHIYNKDHPKDILQ